jgi:hypothetical protein
MKTYTITMIANLQQNEAGEIHAKCSMGSSDMTPFVMQALVTSVLANAQNYLEHKAADGLDVAKELHCCRAAMEALTGDYMGVEPQYFSRRSLPTV